jgi:hypothetical protein
MLNSKRKGGLIISNTNSTTYLVTEDEECISKSSQYYVSQILCHLLNVISSII